MATSPRQIIDVFWAINKESLWEVAKYFSSSPQAGAHAGAKIKQSPRLKIPVLLLNVFEDVDQTGELCRGPGHQVGEAPRLVKVYRRPLASSFNFIQSLKLISTCAYFLPCVPLQMFKSFQHFRIRTVSSVNEIQGKLFLYFIFNRSFPCFFLRLFQRNYNLSIC